MGVDWCVIFGTTCQWKEHVHPTKGFEGWDLGWYTASEGKRRRGTMESTQKESERDRQVQRWRDHGGCMLTVQVLGRARIHTWGPAGKRSCDTTGSLARGING